MEGDFLFFWELRHLFVIEPLKISAHVGDVILWIVVEVAVLKHLVEVCHRFDGAQILIVVQALPDCAQVHRLLDDVEIIRNS